ncbi:MAG: hypothetical protein PHC28_04815 [Flavobacterium sp.]|uniref:hypothetical protein n=1 Tax=Flavobacterium sp. TaxID=239 RepID=UPI00260F811A|nr:hypothetical protein [Flavobacterium sp.]MDD5149787.1 hypothetical protein [Flavobacterium sp.]
MNEYDELRIYIEKINDKVMLKIYEEYMYSYHNYPPLYQHPKIRSIRRLILFKSYFTNEECNYYINMEGFFGVKIKVKRQILDLIFKDTNEIIYFYNNGTESFSLNGRAVIHDEDSIAIEQLLILLRDVHDD